MGSAILLVTWLVYGQPPTSYQTIFNSAVACEVAKAKVLADGERIKTAEAQRTAAMQRPGVYVVPTVPPSVSAVCVDQ